MTTVVWKGKKISAGLCVITDDADGNPYIGVAGKASFRDEAGKVVHFPKTPQGKTGSDALLHALAIQYKIDNEAYIREQRFQGKPVDSGFDKEKLSSSTVAALCLCAKITAMKWAQKNNLRFTGEGRRKTYQWTQADITRFRSRKGPGKTPRKDKPKASENKSFHSIHEVMKLLSWSRYSVRVAAEILGIPHVKNKTYTFTGEDVQKIIEIKAKRGKGEHGNVRKHRKPKDITGRWEGKLIALRCLGTINTGGYVWEWKCDCGNIIEKTIVQAKQMTSCGCSGTYKKGNRPGRKRNTPPQDPRESASAGIAQKTSMPLFVIHKKDKTPEA